MDQEEQMATCQMCGANFESKEALDEHNQKEHGMTPPPPATPEGE